jgi:hypothetical protein
MNSCKIKTKHILDQVELFVHVSTYQVELYVHVQSLHCQLLKYGHDYGGIVPIIYQLD